MSIPNNIDSKFLMHRVELKGYVYLDIEVLNNEGFLMHRVELKAGDNGTFFSSVACS